MTPEIEKFIRSLETGIKTIGETKEGDRLQNLATQQQSLLCVVEIVQWWLYYVAGQSQAGSSLKDEDIKKDTLFLKDIAMKLLKECRSKFGEIVIPAYG